MRLEWIQIAKAGCFVALCIFGGMMRSCVEDAGIKPMSRQGLKFLAILAAATSIASVWGLLNG